MSIQFLESEVHPKKWGSEEWIINRRDYCLKILRFKKGGQFSYHFHDLKTETWYIQSGQIKLKSKNLDLGLDDEWTINAGAIIHVPRLVPHQIEALEDTVIYEVSTEHFELDSYRIAPGDSQK
jgi:mannose-6-phosphate isomerase-like protein (cupin superfamily)